MINTYDTCIIYTLNIYIKIDSNVSGPAEPDTFITNEACEDA